MKKSHTGIRLILLLILALGVGIVGLQGQSFTIAPSPFQVVFDNSGKIVNNACVWTYLAGTTTPATTYADNLGTPNSNPIRSDSAGRFTAYLLAGSNYKFTYESSCTPPSHGTVLRTADNIAGTPSTSATVDVTGTAGETISAGQCAYLSDGSGAKTAGQWFKCDSANTYSSTKPEVGLVPSAIVSGASGTIRVAGSMTGLSSLSVGSLYYAGTAGALTTTAPTLARLLGTADTASSMVVAANPPGVPAGGTIGQIWTSAGGSAAAAYGPNAFFDDFRLSLTPATCITTADVTAATTLVLTPCTGNRITLFDSSGNPTTYTTAELSIAVPATTSQLYDVWVFANSGVPTLEVLAWTNDTTRATALARTNGRWTKNGDSTRLYVGSFRTTGVSGQTEDSVVKRYVWNDYNRAPRRLARQESTASWNYTTNTWRQANASTANQIDVVVGVAEVPIDITLIAGASNTAVGVGMAIGIGEDSTSSPSTQVGGDMFSQVANVVVYASAVLRKYPAVGRHVYAWLEASIATGTTTFVGNGFGIVTVNGLQGWIQG